MLFFKRKPKANNENKMLSDRSIYCKLLSLPTERQGQLILYCPQIILSPGHHHYPNRTVRFSQSQGVFRQTAKQTRTSISSFLTEQSASRVLLDCGKSRSQEKVTIKKSPSQYPKSAASLSDYPNPSTQTSKCSTDICK